MARVPMHDGERFIAKLEQPSEVGDADFVAANMHRLEKLIAQLQDRGYEIAKLQGRARAVRDRHDGVAKRQSGTGR